MIRSPKVFIVVLNYNGKGVLKRCLSSVFRLDYPNFEVVLVDNGSRDGSFEEAKRDFSRSHFIKNQYNLGYSAGNNTGIRFALEKGADYVLLLNYDTEVEPDFLRRLVEEGEKDKRRGVLSPLILDQTKKKVWFSGGRINWLAMKTKHDFFSKKGDFCQSSFISGCAMLIKKEVLARVGLLDEDFFLYWEDVDFSIRARRAGFALGVAPKSRIYHFEKSQENGADKVYWLVISALIFFKKNSPWYLWPWLKTYVYLRQMKNKWDLRRNKNEVVEAVGKAYQDFKKYV